MCACDNLKFWPDRQQSILVGGGDSWEKHITLMDFSNLLQKGDILTVLWTITVLFSKYSNGNT